MSHILALRGCTVEPMAGYLKALGVFRLLSEQADSQTLGWWSGNCFLIESQFDSDGLLDFFLRHYRPTPLVAPWNGGSGFYEGDQREGLEDILTTADPRFAEYRRVLERILSWPEFSIAEWTLQAMLDEVARLPEDRSSEPVRKQARLVERRITELQQLPSDLRALTVPGLRQRASDLSKKTSELAEHVSNVANEASKLRSAINRYRRAAFKDTIVRRCRNQLADSAVAWLDAAIVLRTAGDLDFPPLLGQGGNEGRLDYTNTFMQRVSALLLRPQEHSSESLLRNALFNIPTSALVSGPIGQYDPGRAGGFNQGPGIETKEPPINPWNFVLAMEGAVAWAAGVARRQGIATRAVACSPFTVNASPVGYSSSEADAAASARAEIWMPLWQRPARYEELRALLREGRAEWSGKPVSNALDFAKAVVSLGTSRGIEAFQRYALLKRRGDSNVALPAGRVPVQERPNVDLLRELDWILNRIDHFARQFKRKDPPAQFVSCRRRIDSAIFDFALRGGPLSFQAILIALGQMERFFAQRDLSAEPKLQAPLSGLSPRWLLAADDGSLHYRIALALASIRPEGSVGGIRANLAPIDPTKPWSWAISGCQVAYRGNSLAHRLASVLRRRLTDAERLNCGSLPLSSFISLAPQDAAAFITAPRLLDEDKLESLLFAACLVNWRDGSLSEVRKALRHRWSPADVVMPRDYALLKHLFHPELEVRPEPSILSLLVAGRSGEACEVALRRLRISGLPVRDVSFPDFPDGVRLAAALLIPVFPLENLSRLVLRELPNAATQTIGR